MSQTKVLTMAGGMTRDEFINNYGPLVDTKKAASLLGYSSDKAFRQAIYRGYEPLKGVKKSQNGRKSYFPTTAVFDRLLAIEEAWIETAFEIGGTDEIDQEALHRAIREQTEGDDGEVSNEDIRRLAKQL